MTKQKEELIPFTITKSEFDESTYIGRMWAFKKTCNPMWAFFTNSRITKMTELIAEQKVKEEKNLMFSGKREVLLTKDEIQELRVA
jgi:tricarboxylate carrier